MTDPDAAARAILRELRDQDLALLTRLRNDRSFQRQLMARSRSSSRERVREWAETRAADPRSAWFVVADGGTDEAVGFTQLTEIDPSNGNALLAVAIAPEAQGKGYGRAALLELERVAFDVLNLRKLTLEVLVDNAPAIALYRAMGFLDVGVRRDHFAFDGTHTGVLVMERLSGR